ncbi:unnamed protein product, partial [Durusdinium trenchii]
MHGPGWVSDLAHFVRELQLVDVVATAKPGGATSRLQPFVEHRRFEWAQQYLCR